MNVCEYVFFKSIYLKFPKLEYNIVIYKINRENKFKLLKKHQKIYTEEFLSQELQVNGGIFKPRVTSKRRNF